jgi:Calcineurin-like phosphoesterase
VTLLLGAAGAWLLLALAVEALAWRAHALARRAAPAAFARPPVREAPGASLAFLGDLQRGVADVARPLVAALRRRPADLLVSSGDLAAHGEAPYYGVLFEAFRRAGLETPARVVPGNHDLHPRGVRDTRAGYALFEGRLGPPGWTVRVGSVLVVGLDDAVGPVRPADLEAARAAVEAHAGGPWIAVCHRPPRRVERPDAGIDAGLEDLVALLERHPPRLVVCGHQHAWADREVAGVRYLVNAHGGDVHGLALRRGPAELLRVEVDADGAATFERETIHRRPSPRTYLDQLAVRAWCERRRRPGSLLALPAALLLAALHLRAPRTGHPGRE